MSQPGDLVESVRRGMLVDDPLDSVRVMQEGVAELIRSTEKAVQVHLTGHFNNTWIPDMTLTWPEGGRRDVFLRTAVEEECLHDDLRIEETRHAMIVKLPDLSHGPARLGPADSAILGSLPEGPLGRSAVESHALVAETESLGEVADSTTRFAGLGIFSRSLIRGGQGFLPRRSVAPVLSAIEKGFKGAALGEAESTERGLEVASQYLSAAEDRKIEELLQLIWIGAGHVSTAFPSRRTHVSASLDSSSLTFLLDNEEVGDDEFWNRLASTIDFDVILGLGDRADAPIDRLVRRVVGGLMAKGCAVEQSDEVVSNSEGVAPACHSSRWSVEGSILKLVAERRNFLVAPSRSRIPSVAAVNLTSSELLERSQRYDAKVSSLEVVGGDRSVMLGGLSGGLVMSDVNGLNRLVGDQAPIRSAQIKSSRGGLLEIQPTQARVAGNSNSHWGVEDLVRSAAEMLADVDLPEEVFASLPESDPSSSLHEGGSPS